MAYDEIRQTKSKKDSKCCVCSETVEKHQDCFVDPKTYDVWHLSHGKDKSIK